MHELSEQPFFPPVMPASLASKDKEDEGGGPIRTQMVGEAPGEDLGYDPSKIPTEKIPDDLDDDVDDDEDDEQ